HEAIARSIAIEPRRNLEARRLDLQVLLAEHRFREAGEGAALLWRTHPEEPSLLALWGDAELELGRLERARARFIRFRERAPGLGAAGRLARLAHLEGDSDRAINLYALAFRSADGVSLIDAVWALN